jgi:uncharacterized protein (TIGR03435 family)
MKIRPIVLFVVAPAALVTVISLPAQTPVAKPKFEVVSVKVNKSGPPQGTTVGAHGSTFSAVNATLRMVLLFAFRPHDGTPLVGRLVDGPAWLDTDRFDVLGKLDGDSRSIPRQQIQLMVQSLLEDRCALVVHREIRSVPVFNLVVEKPGKLKMSSDQSALERGGDITFGGTEPLTRGSVRITSSPESTTITGNAVTIPRLILVLQGRTDRIIVDQTDLSGLFDFTLKFASETAAGAAGTNDLQPSDPAPALSTTLGELGLKLESGKAPREVVVIDSIQKPTEN